MASDNHSNSATPRAATWLVAGGLSLLAGALLWVLQDGPAGGAAHGSGGRQVAVQPARPEPAHGSVATAEPARRPQPAAGGADLTDSPLVDLYSVMGFLQQIQRDAEGALVIDTGTARLLQQAARALDDRADAATIALLGELIEAELPGAEGEKARHIFTTFLEYQAAEQHLLSQAQAGDLATSAAVLEQTIALRRSYFGPGIAEQLFAEEEQFIRETIARMHTQH